MDQAPTTAEVDAYILAELPASFQSLVQRKLVHDIDWYRPIDRGLQRLRKKGLVTFQRQGRFIIWSAKEPSI